MNYAGFWRRFAASIIDSIILMIPSMLLTATVHNVGFSVGSGFLIGFLYYPFFESSALAGTPGKALLGLAIVSEAGGDITFKQAVIRFFCKYLSALLAFIGYLMQPFTAKRQTLHDMIAEVVVIRKENSPEMNYFSVWKANFKKVVDKL